MEKKYQKMPGKFIVVVGGTSTGKSTWIEENLIAPGISHGVPFVIVDILGEYAQDFPELNFEDPSREYVDQDGFLSVENARNLFKKIQRQFSTGEYLGKIVILEESNQMLTTTEAGSKQITTQMMNLSKHKGAVMVFVYQSFEDIPSKLLRRSDQLVIKKTTHENLQRLERVMSPKEYPRFWKLFWEVQNSPDPFETRIYTPSASSQARPEQKKLDL